MAWPCGCVSKKLSREETRPPASPLFPRPIWHALANGHTPKNTGQCGLGFSSWCVCKSPTRSTQVTTSTAPRVFAGHTRLVLDRGVAQKGITSPSVPRPMLTHERGICPPLAQRSAVPAKVTAEFHLATHTYACMLPSDSRILHVYFVPLPCTDSLCVCAFMCG